MCITDDFVTFFFPLTVSEVLSHPGLSEILNETRDNLAVYPEVNLNKNRYLIVPIMFQFNI